MGLMEQVIREREEEMRPLCDKVRANLLEAIQILAEAASRPLTSRSTLERARPLLQEAMRAAIALDPDDEPESRKDDEFHPKVGAVTNHCLNEDQRLDAQVNR